ncbi:hypothetical protein [Paraburkholderia sp. DGU8]|uniref:hypothetical protein n=1 Tax=Paraburkholderia sp. DGU8 TaxID=3161997 RepID=UPI003466266D
MQVFEGPACKDCFATLGFYNARRFDQVSRVTFEKDGSRLSKAKPHTSPSHGIRQTGQVNRSKLLF